MQLTVRIGAAMAIVALAGCSQSTTQDNAANLDANSEMTVNETVLPQNDAMGNSDTLGNQLNQLNESGSEASNSSENSSVDQ